MYDTTCICPVTGRGISCSFAVAEDKDDGKLCQTVSSDKKSCAASSGVSSNDNLTYVWSDMEKYIDAIIDADPHQGNAIRCPSTGVAAYYYEGSYSYELNKTMNNVSAPNMYDGDFGTSRSGSSTSAKARHVENSSDVAAGWASPS